MLKKCLQFKKKKPKKKNTKVCTNINNTYLLKRKNMINKIRKNEINRESIGSCSTKNNKKVYAANYNSNSSVTSRKRK